MKFYLVDVKDINSDVPRSNFSENDIENLADTILESGGIIRPLVLKETDTEVYKVVDGHLEYYAAVRAKEKDPRKGEMVNAFVISPKLEDLVVKQALIIDNLQASPDKSIKQTTTTLEPDTAKLESRLTNLELRLERQISNMISELMQERQRVDNRFKHFESQIPQSGEINAPLHLLNTLDENSLFLKLKRSRISGAEKVAKSIVEARKKKPQKEFDNYRDVKQSVKGMGDITILTIIDEW